RVTSLATGKTVIVRVNDRGPFLHNRVIDLSFAAATRIGIAQKGSGEVEVESIIPIEMTTVASAAPLPPVVTAPLAPPTSAGAPAGASPASQPTVSVPVAATDSGFVVQLGAFASNANAENFLAHIAAPIGQVGVQPRVRQVGGLFRVFVGPYATRDEAKRTADRLRDALGLDSMIAVH